MLPTEDIASKFEDIASKFEVPIYTFQLTNYHLSIQLSNHSIEDNASKISLRGSNSNLYIPGYIFQSIEDIASGMSLRRYHFGDVASRFDIPI